MKSVFEKIVVIGSGKMAHCCAKIVREKCDAKVMVISYKPQVESGLQILCEKSSIPYKSYQESYLLDEALMKLEEKTLIISAFNIYIFPKNLVRKNFITIINYHPALLPKHPGRNAEAWTIFEQDGMTGVTWHKVTEKIDDVDILIQKEIALNEQMTSLKLMIIQQKIALEAFQEIVEQLLLDKVSVYKQTKMMSKVHYAREIPNDGILNTHWNMEKISAFLRAMDYGKLNILGRPIIMLEGISYTWVSYRIINEIDEKKAVMKDTCCIKKENLILVLCGMYRYERRNE